MTYYLYVDGGGTPTVPTYFSYILYENDKPAGAIVNNGIKETIECHRYFTRFIPPDEIPLGCSLIDKRGLETSNLSEFMAQYYGLKRVKEVSGLMPLTVRQDSQLVINQVNNVWQCKQAHLIPWLNAINSIKWTGLQFEWIPREYIVKILGH